VQFGDAVALCARQSEYRDRLELRSISDRTLGLGVSLSSSLLLVLSATTMMKVSLDLDRIEAFKPEYVFICFAIWPTTKPHPQDWEHEPD
jgi:nuclear pore complex protein Nup133